MPDGCVKVQGGTHQVTGVHVWASLKRPNFLDFNMGIEKCIESPYGRCPGNHGMQSGNHGRPEITRKESQITNPIGSALSRSCTCFSIFISLLQLILNHYSKIKCRLQKSNVVFYVFG